MTLETAIAAIQTIVGGVSGIRSAPAYVPDKPSPGIFAVSLPANGVFRQQPVQVLEGLHNVELYVLCPRIDLPKTLKSILPLGELVCVALENDETLSSTCETFGDITYTFNPLLNLGTPAEPAWYSGWIFTITEIKIQDSSSLT